MSQTVLKRLSAQFGDRVLETSDFRGDEVAVISADDWVEVVTFLRDDPDLVMNQLIDLTAVDWPEREPEGPRFDVVLMLRSIEKKHRLRLKARVADGAPMPTLTGVYAGAMWPEREVWDMFGIHFDGHPDMRRILLYEEFEGHPLRKDYPIERTQPLVPYRDAGDIQKLPPFGADQGQPWARVQWEDRLQGADQHVSPAIATQVGKRRSLSDSEVALSQQERLDRDPADPAPTAASEE